MKMSKSKITHVVYKIQYNIDKKLLTTKYNYLQIRNSYYKFDCLFFINIMYIQAKSFEFKCSSSRKV